MIGTAERVTFIDQPSEPAAQLLSPRPIVMTPPTRTFTPGPVGQFDAPSLGVGQRTEFPAVTTTEPTEPTYFGYTKRQLLLRGVRLGVYGAMGYLVTRVLMPKHAMYGVPAGMAAGYGVERITG